jgi:hypothetical protein
MAMVLRSMYLDSRIDAELAARAEEEGTTKAELMRRFIDEGLSRPATTFAGYAAPEAKDARRSRSSRSASAKKKKARTNTPAARRASR